MNLYCNKEDSTDNSHVVTSPFTHQNSEQLRLHVKCYDDKWIPASVGGQG
jgi:hypothetical protein